MKLNISQIALLSVLIISPVSAQEGSGQRAPDFSGLYMPSRDFSLLIMFPMANPPYSKWAQNHANEFNNKFNAITDQPTSFCVPPGMPASMALPAPFPLEIIQRPQDITLFFEAYAQYRKIYIDGYPRPEPQLASKMGYSVGHWEGEELVVETTFLAEQTLGLGISSGEGHITERMHLEADSAGNKRLVDNIVYSDLLAYTNDITMRGVWDSSPDTPIMEYVCTEEIYEQYLNSFR
jgi:hypothetical protein